MRLNVADLKLNEEIPAVGLNRKRLQQVLAKVTRTQRSGSYRNELATLDNPEVIREYVKDVIEARGGEVAARKRAEIIAHAFLELTKDQQHTFFELLKNEYGVDQLAVQTAIQNFDLTSDQSTTQLRTALEPIREQLFRRFVGVDDGLAFLVTLREDLLEHKDPQFSALDSELKSLLNQCFDVGLLTLHQITWDSPAALLEKLIEYEAVHAIQSWDDLRKRLGEDRRLYAFQHPALPNDLLIFVEVALIKGLAHSIDDLLDPATEVLDTKNSDTAIFYSISNCQPGLSGVRLGDFLIKRVVSLLTSEIPSLKNFATLSPIPGFVKWLTSAIEHNDLPIFTREQQLSLNSVQAALQNPEWHQSDELKQQLEPVLSQLCFYYLTSVKRGDRISDPVANFHLSNGARIEQIQFLANTRPDGLAQSLGMMVNYRYVLDYIEENHDAYVHEGHVEISKTLLELK
jgi:malonyl-CoA decarboxylase